MTAPDRWTEKARELIRDHTCLVLDGPHVQAIVAALREAYGAGLDDTARAVKELAPGHYERGRRAGIEEAAKVLDRHAADALRVGEYIDQGVAVTEASAHKGLAAYARATAARLRALADEGKGSDG